MCDKYLESYHKEIIFQILEDENENKHFSININFVELFENDPDLGSSLLKEPEKSLEDWDNALKKVQTQLILKSERNYVFKKHVHCRICGLPVCPDLHRTKFPLNEDANKFLQISGTVVRMTAMKMLESQRQYICVKCKYVMTVNADYEMKNIIVPPKKCLNPEDCKGTNIVTTGELDPELCKDYQEIKIQETVSKLDVGCIPNSMWVTLEDDLVDSCKPGDNITVCGVVKRRWSQFFVGKKIEIQLVIKANHIQVNNNHSSTSVTTDLKDMFRMFWKTYADRPLAARDIILKSICPQIFGLYIVKLAIAITLAGGSHLDNNVNTGVRVRAEPHLLLVGDPGTGKSQLLRFASKIIPRSVLTTGVGSTAAGLTVTAVMEGGEWQLEGGALVLADGGICCIDEFNSMKEHDRTSIHEAMEQQSISVAKASIVCKLNTRCSILAATNPKGNVDSSQPLNMNIALPSPLLSRFDLILLLRDKVNETWDSLVADYILNEQDNCCKLVENIYWTVETLQAYFAAIKKIHPVLTDDSNKILSSYYQAQRRKDSRNKSRTTVRLLDSLVRLSQGHARLMFHEEVQIIDAVVAVTLVETAMEADSSVFDLHFDIQHDFPDNPMNNYRELVEIVLKKLHLDDLLEKELDSLNNRTSSISVKMNLNKNGGTSKESEHKTESKFFHQKEVINSNDIDKENKENDNEHEFVKRPINVQKIKRTKNCSNANVKKIKLNDKKNYVMNDLAALECMPSILDVPFLSDSGDDDINLDLEVHKTKEVDHENDVMQHKSCKETSESVTENVFDDKGKENSEEGNQNKKIIEVNGSDSEKIEKTEKTPKCKQYLSKFKFVPKENRNTNTTEMIENTNEEKKTKIKNLQQSCTNVNSAATTDTNNTNNEKNALKIKCFEQSKIPNSSESLKSDEILKDFETVPQSTQREKPKFKFKKIENQQNVETETKSLSVEPSSSTTIFETEEDLVDLDLDL